MPAHAQASGIGAESANGASENGKPRRRRSKGSRSKGELPGETKGSRGNALQAKSSTEPEQLPGEQASGIGSALSGSDTTFDLTHDLTLEDDKLLGMMTDALLRQPDLPIVAVRDVAILDYPVAVDGLGEEQVFTGDVNHGSRPPAAHEGGRSVSFAPSLRV